MPHRFSFSAGRSRRRRLLIRQIQDTEAARDSQEPIPDPYSPLSTVPSQATTQDVPTRRSLAEMLSGSEPLSWLFIGDSYTSSNREPLAWRSFATRFTGAVRSHFERPRDLFIDGTFASARLSELLFDFGKRIAKFDPDLCFLSLAVQEADARSTERFEKMLLRLIEWARLTGCQLILQTPPCFPTRNDLELTRRLVFAEAVRSLAAEHDLPMVDHWEHWEGHLNNEKGSPCWLDTQSGLPSEEGHRQLALRLIRDLQLRELRQSLTRDSSVVVNISEDQV